MAQKSFGIVLEPLDQESSVFIEQEWQKPIKMDSIAVYQYANELIRQQRAKGKYLASVDEIIFNDSTAALFFYLGDVYRLANVRPGNISKNLLDLAGVRSFEMQNQVLDPKKVESQFDQIISYLENNGYPFATIRLDSIEILDGALSAQFNLIRNSQINFDTLQTSGDVKISNQFLSKYLDIDQGEPYNKEKILAVKPKMQQLPFIELKQDPVVTFQANSAILNLELAPLKSSRFDFLFGILPGGTAGDRNLTIAIDFTADLHNKLGLGEHIYAEFQRIKENTQELDLGFSYPYLLDLPFGLDASFNLFKNEDQYLDLKSNLGIQYLFNGANTLKAFWNFSSSSLLELDTLQIRNSGRLPTQLDVSYNGGGVALTISKLDYKFNPRKGYMFNIRGTTGFKKIKRNQKIIDLTNEANDFSALYDSLKLKTFQFDYITSFDYFIPMGIRGTLMQRLDSGWIVSEENTYQNELFRVGGIKRLRGFDEESLLAKAFAIYTLEYRLLLARNSYLSLPFLDFGYIQRISDGEEQWDSAYGFGAGIHFETTAGIFSFSVAVGSLMGNPLDFGTSKAHFGYVSLF